MASDTDFTSITRLAGPIDALSKYRKSLLFAELARISYLNEEHASRAASEVGFAQARFLDHDGSQAYIFENAHDCVVACRGTEPNEWNDIKADANAIHAIAETIGRVHSGFKREVDDLWPALEQTLVENEKPTWFTGHSLGGAMATICAGRCRLSHIRSIPRELYTFGSPRVGTSRYVNHSPVQHTRWINNNDIVARVPPTWLGYRHCGEEIYLNAYGKVRKLTGWQRTKDRWRGFFSGLKQGRIDHFSDHSIHHYVKHIRAAIEELEGATG